MKKKNIKGFSLIELMIAVAILAIILMVGVPSFNSSINKNSVASTINDIQTTLNEARSEALTLGLTVSVCSSNNQSSCSGTWSDGWILFSDENENGTVDGADKIISVSGEVNGGNSLRLAATNTSMLQYMNNGYPSQTGVFIGCPSDKDATYSRALIVNPSGMVRKSRDSDANGTYEDDTNTDLTCP